MTKLIAVIHYRDIDTAFKNAEIAAAADFDGVCLIHMQGLDELLDAPATAIKSRYPHMTVITNRLRMDPVDMILRDADLGLDGSWCDNPGVSSKGVTPFASRIEDALLELRKTKPDFLFFGSVAFKTQEHDPDPATAAVKAKNLGWIATTSGTATGVAPDEDKLERMKTAIASFDLAVASGITPENAGVLCQHVDWVLVSTGISASFYEFDAGKAEALRKAVPLD